MQPEPFASNSNQPQPQPFSDSSASPMQNAPVTQPSGAMPASSLSPASPTGAPFEGALEANDGLAALVKAHSSGANWFFWIVGLSLVNTGLILFGSETTMAIGTSATLFMDVVAREAIAKTASTAGIMRGIEVVFDLLVLGFYAFCGIMAVRGKTWAFYLGMTFFALDMLLSIAFKQVIGGLIHAWALFTMWQGAQALKQIQAIHRAAQEPVSPWTA